MGAVDEQDERDDLAAYIAKQAESDPGFPQAVADALERRRAQRRVPGRASMATGEAPQRDLTKIGRHAIADNERQR